ncbi:MAG: aspartate--tRNA ligase, partial [Terriglobia bacterium]
ETPFLTRSTPEGARDYLVPSRVHPGHFYALPQSPQLFKQLLMIAGFDRYFQIVRCFRDEDLRADRQPEFTQLDLEMAFATRDAVFAVIEDVMKAAFAAGGESIQAPFPRMSYAETLARYGTDKPDTRFGLEMVNLSRVFAGKIISGTVQPPVWGFVVPGATRYSRRQLDELKAYVQGLGAQTLYYAKVTEKGIESPLSKMLGQADIEQLQIRTGATVGDLILAAPSDAPPPSFWPQECPSNAVAELRLRVAEQEGLIPKGQWAFLWVTDFPVFEWSGTENRWTSSHHPFTAPAEDDLDKLEADPGRVRSQAYDLVLNGVELGSGSIRIHRPDIQQRVFRVLGLSDEEARQRFGFFLDALSYGTPPHGGIALGLDRIVALLAGETSIREVIAFPKTTAAQDLMAAAPARVSPEPLRELGFSDEQLRKWGYKW